MSDTEQEPAPVPYAVWQKYETGFPAESHPVALGPVEDNPDAAHIPVVIKPWSEDLTATEDAKNAWGYHYLMDLPQGGRVWVWVPNAAVEDVNLRYYCHGHSLKTWSVKNNHGYSVNMSSMYILFSDRLLVERIVAEQDHELRRPIDQAGVVIQKDDIVAWWSKDPEDNSVQCEHTALIVEPMYKDIEGRQHGALADGTTMMSKNGSAPPAPCTLGFLRTKYPGLQVLGIYRVLEEPSSEEECTARENGTTWEDNREQLRKQIVAAIDLVAVNLANMNASTPAGLSSSSVPSSVPSTAGSGSGSTVHSPATSAPGSETHLSGDKRMTPPPMTTHDQTETSAAKKLKSGSGEKPDTAE